MHSHPICFSSTTQPPPLVPRKKNPTKSDLHPRDNLAPFLSTSFKMVLHTVIFVLLSAQLTIASYHYPDTYCCSMGCTINGTCFSSKQGSSVKRCCMEPSWNVSVCYSADEPPKLFPMEWKQWNSTYITHSKAAK